MRIIYNSEQDIKHDSLLRKCEYLLAELDLRMETEVLDNIADQQHTSLMDVPVSEIVHSQDALGDEERRARETINLREASNIQSRISEQIQWGFDRLEVDPLRISEEIANIRRRLNGNNNSPLIPDRNTTTYHRITGRDDERNSIPQNVFTSEEVLLPTNSVRFLDLGVEQPESAFRHWDHTNYANSSANIINPGSRLQSVPQQVQFRRRRSLEFEVRWSFERNKFPRACGGITLVAWNTKGETFTVRTGAVY